MELADSKYDTFDILVSEIWIDPEFNCRKNVSDESVEDLTESIRNDGLHIPIMVQLAEECQGVPEGFKYKLICGERRTIAFKILGLKTIPAILKIGLSPEQMVRLNFDENLRRKDLNIWEEALAIDKIFPVYRTIESIAKELNKPKIWVKVRRDLILMPDFVKKNAALRKFTDKDLLLIEKSDDPEAIARKLIGAAKTKRKTIFLKGDKGIIRQKSEVRKLITKLLHEGFNPNFLRLVSWTIGDVSEAGLIKSLRWLRERKNWLR